MAVFALYESRDVNPKDSTAVGPLTAYCYLPTAYCYDVAMMNVPPPPPPAAANPLRGAQLSFVGVGVMAEAMVAGLLRRQLVTRAQIVGSHPRPARRDELHNQYGIRMFESNAEAARHDAA